MIAAILAALLPFAEMRVVDRVAADCRLNAEQRALLIAIRRAENGRAHIAWGVADARCRTYERQARWAANTIRLRYDGDLRRFARRWNQEDTANWLKNVRFFMRKQGFNK